MDLVVTVMYGITKITYIPQHTSSPLIKKKNSLAYP